VSTVEIPDVDIDQIRRHVSAEYGLTIGENDPIVMSVALAMMATRQVISEERAKRADENLLTYKDVRHVLEDVRNDSLQFSQEIVGLALDQISKIIAAEHVQERRSWAAIIDRYKVWLGALIAGGTVHFFHSF